jgi:hypothetical protein
MHPWQACPTARPSWSSSPVVNRRAGGSLRAPTSPSRHRRQAERCRWRHPPIGLATDWYGEWAYLLGSDVAGEVLAVLDTSTNRLIAHLPLGAGPSRIATAKDRLFRCHTATGALYTYQIVS